MADSGRGGGRRTKKRSGNVGEYRLDIASLGPDHRANAIDESAAITPSSHQRMTRSWPVVCPILIQILEEVKFDQIRHLKLIVHDPKLLTALVERWCPMTNTFHLPVGEMTITLQDVGILLGVRVDGPALVGPVVVGEGNGMSWTNSPLTWGCHPLNPKNKKKILREQMLAIARDCIDGRLMFTQ